jgi:hypothetical protein
MRLVATWLVLSSLMVVALGSPLKAQAFLPSTVTAELEESPVDEEATKVSCKCGLAACRKFPAAGSTAVEKAVGAQQQCLLYCSHQETLCITSQCAGWDSEVSLLSDPAG